SGNRLRTTADHLTTVPRYVRRIALWSRSVMSVGRLPRPAAAPPGRGTWWPTPRRDRLLLAATLRAERRAEPLVHRVHRGELPGDRDRVPDQPSGRPAAVVRAGRRTVLLRRRGRAVLGGGERPARRPVPGPTRGRAGLVGVRGQPVDDGSRPDLAGAGGQYRVPGDGPAGPRRRAA